MHFLGNVAADHDVFFKISIITELIETGLERYAISPFGFTPWGLWKKMQAPIREI